VNISEEKIKIRKEIKRRRAELSAEVVDRIDMLLPDFIFDIDDEELQQRLGNARRIALYRSFGGEVPVERLSESLIKKGIKCCFPRIENGNMVFCDCSDLNEDFISSSFDIKEPSADKKSVDPKEIDVVVLPAVAYNEEGTRLGMGGGYYDRFISSYVSERPYLLGVCYEFQICSDVPSEPHDAVADFIAVISEELYGE